MVMETENILDDTLFSGPLRISSARGLSMSLALWYSRMVSWLFRTIGMTRAGVKIG